MAISPETSIYEYAKQGLSYGKDRTAIWFYGRSISYGELFEKIDNVADHLYALGVRQGTVVTIHLPNCPQAVMAIYAVAKLGGICNMVHALTPIEEVKKTLPKAQTPFLITHLNCIINCRTFVVDVTEYMGDDFKNGFKGEDSPRFVGNDFLDLEIECPVKGHYPKKKELADKPVVYLHSSGTTGESKTVIHCHAAINQSVANAVDYYKLRSRTDEVVLAVLPLFHGMGLAHVMHISLTGGAQLIQLIRWDASSAASLVDSLKATLIVGVPKMFSDLLNLTWFKGTSLRHCFVAGDNVAPELKASFNERTGKKHCLYEAYGLTETVVGVCSCSAEHDNLESCGYPVSNSDIRVLDDYGQPQKTGIGELVVSINTFMLGYLDDPVGTRAVFMNYDGKRWLKTGDIGRIDEEGYVYFIDRKKDIIIHNGYNVFPLEIESFSRIVTGVADICVVGRRIDGSEQIWAFVETDGTRTCEEIESQLIDLWKEHLPSYAIPKQIRFVDKLPRNIMGKVTREDLR